ncbi:response regulator transcription factor [Paenibacillus guangzhouensis]|uniref:response regulator transcription factor n=1 Tax=Paenibacillus guangzhouensis TaxID=1473112 RepID=UPI00126691C9|nr:response regulator transcription factor [Paenibacillus guangzhouensis]
MSERILIIEDDHDISARIQELLTTNGYEPEIASDGEQGLTTALQGSWNLILLDLSLPGLSGLEVLQAYREQGRKTPVIIITALDRTESVVESFEIGANDYITKPFHSDVLLVRVRNLLNIFRHVGVDDAEAASIIIDDLQIEPDARKVIRGGEIIDLTPKEFDLLLHLAKNKNKVCSRENILNAVWGYEFMADTNVIDVFIRYVRQKIDKGRKNKLIQTIRGIGYSLQEGEQESLEREE